MLLDQPGDELGVLLREAVLAAEAPGIAGAQRGVVAAAALGDVVEEAGEVEHLDALEVRHQPRAQRVLVRVLRPR